MFSFFAYLNAIYGILATGYNLFTYVRLYQRDPWDVNNFDYLKSAIVIFFVSLIGFLMLRKLAKMEKSIDKLECRLNSLSSKLDRVNYKTGDKNVDVEKEARAVDEIKQKISKEKADKYQAHIRYIENKLFSGVRNKNELREDVLAPKRWDENIFGTQDERLALYRYYEDLLPILLRAKAHEDVILNACEEAYRLIGFLGENLKGECSEIMSYYCDVEKKTYGKSARLTAMCQKLDSIGVLDRGLPFSCRLR